MVLMLYRISWRLDISGYATVLSFFFAELTALTLYIINAFDEDPAGGVPVAIARNTLYFVLFYYAYHMQIVKIKVESEDYLICKKRVRLVRILWGCLIALTLIELAFEIIEAVNIAKKDKDEFIIGITVVGRLLNTVDSGCLLYLQWSQFLFFVRQKRERRELEGEEPFTQKEKLLICWFFTLLFLNSVSLISYAIVEVLI